MPADALPPLLEVAEPVLLGTVAALTAARLLLRRVRLGRDMAALRRRIAEMQAVAPQLGRDRPAGEAFPARTTLRAA